MGYRDKRQKAWCEVAYHPRQRVLLATRLECRLAAVSRPRNGDERRSLALWAVRESTSHWGLSCLILSLVHSAMNQCSFHIVLVFLENFSFSKRIAIILVLVFVLVMKITLVNS